MHEFSNKEQCYIVGQHIVKAHGQYRGWECLPLDGQSHPEEQNNH